MLHSGRHLRSHNADIKHHSQIIYRQIVFLREQPQLSEQRPPSLFFSHSYAVIVNSSLGGATTKTFVAVTVARSRTSSSIASASMRKRTGYTGDPGSTALAALNPC